MTTVARRAHFLLLVGGCCAVLGGAGQALAQAKSDQVPEARLSVAQGPAFPLGQAAARWAELANDRAAGAFTVKVYPGAVLAARDPARELGALRDGGAELAVGSALQWSAQLPAFAVYALPWGVADARAQQALVADADVRTRLAAAAAHVGVVVLAVAPLGERVVATTAAPLRTPAEVAGRRIRMPANPLLQETYAALGARPEAMDLAQAQAAFAAGTLDGQDAAPSTLAATRIAATGQKFVTRWGAFADAMVFAVGRAAWDAWPEAQRTRVRAAALDAASAVDAVAREDAALADLTRQGVTIVQLGAAQQAAFRAAVAPVVAKWTPLVGGDLAAAAQRAASVTAPVNAPAPPVSSTAPGTIPSATPSTGATR